MKPLTLAQAKEQAAQTINGTNWTVAYDEYMVTNQLIEEAMRLHSLSCQEALREKIANHPDLQLTTLEKQDILTTPLITE